MTRSEWIQVVVLATTMITAIWWFGRNTVTREDLAAFEQELRAHVDAQTQELRAHVDAQMQELRAEMRELRGYIVEHLDGHPVD